MKHIRLLAVQHPWHMDLLAQRVVRRRFEDGAEVGTELRRYVEVRVLAEQHVLAVVIDPREVPQEVADVSADAEVVELARINRNAHPLPSPIGGVAAVNRRAGTRGAEKQPAAVSEGHVPSVALA